eukprot:TRINITY_DN240_c0_g1_i1.p1 TRINITY_DN240_c0_g1~~TRINITY_DN240_c0_g1_i1.p1  ORF type:complete len:295 (+),score=58.05 TRINITY_DN240_c0_g1_i1:788-1672(+)
MWYSVTLCKGPNVNNKITYYSYKVASGGACPAVLDLSEAGGKTKQTFPIERKFMVDGLKYNPVILRTSGTASLSFQYADSANKKVFETTKTVARRLLEAQSQGTIVGADDEESAPAARKLLKGSSGRGSRASSTAGGSRSRTRTGADARYGGSTARTTTYGTTSRSAVTSSTVVVVYRPGPRTSASKSNYDQTTAHSSCTDRATGCEYTLPANLNRDEFTKNPILPDGLKFPLNFIMLNSTIQPATTSQEPEIYGTLYTEDSPPEYIAGAIILSVGCLLCCITACVAGAKLSDD